LDFNLTFSWFKYVTEISRVKTPANENDHPERRGIHPRRFYASITVAFSTLFNHGILDGSLESSSTPYGTT